MSGPSEAAPVTSISPPSLTDLLDRAASTCGDCELDCGPVRPVLSGQLPAVIVEALGDRLVKINAPGHQLTSLPASFASLHRLRVAFFLGNRFEAVPAVVGQLQSLFMLSFKSNAIREVPESSLPPSVGWLILTDNAIPRLPRSLGQLTLLRKLMLASNRLTALPDELGLCKSLELVRLSDNLLETLPESFLRLPRLAWVALAGNPLCAAAAAERAAAASGVAAPVPRINAASVELGARLGQGASGAVYRCRVPLPTGGGGGASCECAVKVFNATSSDGRPEDEVAAALALPPHPHLIRTLGYYRRGGHEDGGGGTPHPPSAAGDLGLVMELVEGVLLGGTPSFASVTRDVFPPGASLPVAAAVAVARGVASALSHMHAHGFAHGDVYAHNIIVTAGPDGAPGAASKLGDLGAAFAVPPALAARLERVEARAFGCLVEDLLVLCNIATGYPAAEGASCSAAESEALAGLARVKVRCLAADPSARPSFAEIVKLLPLPVTVAR